MPEEMTEEMKKDMQGGFNFLRKTEIGLGESVTVKIVGWEECKTGKFQILNRDYCYRFTLEDGRIWDETTQGIFSPLLRILFPEGVDNPFVPATVKLTKNTTKEPKKTQYSVTKVDE